MEILLRARPARIEHLAEQQDGDEDNAPDRCEEQWAELGVCWKRSSKCSTRPSARIWPRPRICALVS